MRVLLAQVRQFLINALGEFALEFELGGEQILHLLGHARSDPGVNVLLDLDVEVGAVVPLPRLQGRCWDAVAVRGQHL